MGFDVCVFLSLPPEDSRYEGRWFEGAHPDIQRFRLHVLLTLVTEGTAAQIPASLIQRKQVCISEKKGKLSDEDLEWKLIDAET